MGETRDERQKKKRRPRRSNKTKFKEEIESDAGEWEMGRIKMCKNE